MEKRLKIAAGVEMTDGKSINDIDHNERIVSDSVKVPERVKRQEENREIINSGDEPIV